MKGMGTGVDLEVVKTMDKDWAFLKLEFLVVVFEKVSL